MSTNGPTGISAATEALAAKDYTVAYEQMLPEFSAIPETECLEINTDVAFAASNGMLAGLRCLSIRPEVLVHLPTFDVSVFDKLDPAARACAQAQANYTFATTPTESAQELESRLLKTRSMLITDIRALEQRGHIDAGGLEELKNPSGYKNLAFGVLSLVAHLRANWATIQSRTGVTLEELTEAQQLAQRLNAVSTLRGAKPEPGPAALARKQSFTLLVRLHDQVRRAVTHLRWGKDIEEWCPALYFNAREGKSSRTSEPREPSGVPTQQSGNPGTPGSPTVVMQPVQGFSGGSGMPGESPTGG